MEYWSVGVLRQVGIAPAWRVGAAREALRLVLPTARSGHADFLLCPSAAGGPLPFRCVSAPRSQRDFHSVQESVVVKRFQEAIDGAVRQHSRSQSLGLMRGDKDNGNRMPRDLQLSLQVWPAHAVQSDVEDQTIRGD
jgi:hypothetical protein